MNRNGPKLEDYWKRLVDDLKKLGPGARLGSPHAWPALPTLNAAVCERFLRSKYLKFARRVLRECHLPFSPFEDSARALADGRLTYPAALDDALAASDMFLGYYYDEKGNKHFIDEADAPISELDGFVLRYHRARWEFLADVAKLYSICAEAEAVGVAEAEVDRMLSKCGECFAEVASSIYDDRGAIPFSESREKVLLSLALDIPSPHWLSSFDYNVILRDGKTRDSMGLPLYRDIPKHYFMGENGILDAFRDLGMHTDGESITLCDAFRAFGALYWRGEFTLFDAFRRAVKTLGTFLCCSGLSPFTPDDSQSSPAPLKVVIDGMPETTENALQNIADTRRGKAEKLSNAGRMGGKATAAKKTAMMRTRKEQREEAFKRVNERIKRGEGQNQAFMNVCNGLGSDGKPLGFRTGRKDGNGQEIIDPCLLKDSGKPLSWKSLGREYRKWARANRDGVTP